MVWFNAHEHIKHYIHVRILKNSQFTKKLSKSQEEDEGLMKCLAYEKR